MGHLSGQRCSPENDLAIYSNVHTTYFLCDSVIQMLLHKSLMNFLDYSRKLLSFVASYNAGTKNGGQITFRLVHLYQCMCTIFKTGVYLESYTANT